MASSTASRTATTRTVTRINRTAILDALEQHGPMSRGALQEVTGLSSATVDRLCAALLTEQLIARHGVDRSSPGRPANLFRFAGERRVVVAADVTAQGARGTVLGVDGTTLAHASRTTLAGAPADARLDAALAVVDELLASARAHGRTCLGIGLAVPGVVDPDGRVSNSAELGWQRLAVGSIVGHRFGLPTHVENDANAVAFGEWTRGVAAGTSSAASLVLGTGIGAGLVMDGRLLRGARSGAGEIGYLLTERSAFGRLYAHQGDLESRIGAAARTWPGAGDGTGPAAALLDAAAAGDVTAVGPAAELVDYLALSLSALASVVDPEVVVLSGRLPRDVGHLVRELEQRLTGRIPFPPRLVPGALGAEAALLGVGELIARQVKGSTYVV